MNIHINPEILVCKGIKNKQQEIKITIDNPNKPTKLIIRARSATKGRSKGIIGTVKDDGTIVAPENVIKLITPQIKEKVRFNLELILDPKQSLNIKIVKISKKKSKTR
jgi:hypothetical protein